jgi:hypothetical protein
MPKKKNIDVSKLSEPVTTYSTVRIYNSFEEAEAEQLRKNAFQSPENRIKEAVELILRVYGLSRKELSERKTDNRVTILRREWIYLLINISSS